MTKLITFAWNTFYVLYAVAFTIGMFFVFFRSHTGQSPILLPFITVVFALPLLLRLWRLSERLDLSDRAHKWILLIFIVASGMLQIILGDRLRFVPMWDMEAIFDGGRMWALTGTLDNPTVFHGTYLRYFAMKSVMWGGVFLFRCLFWIYDFFGGTDFHVPALVWSVTMVQAMVLALHSAATRLKGPRAGLFVLFLLAVFLPFHFFGAAYYTDTLSMPFVAIAFAFYLRAKDEENLRKKLIFFAACGLAVAIGSALKTTALIVFIAIFIDFLLTIEKRGWPKRLVCAGTMALAFIIVFGGFYMYMSRVVIGPELTERYRLPRTHWMMMGLQGHGHYCPNDFAFTMGIYDLETRQSETTRIVMERLQERGVSGMAYLYSAKFAINFGDGTYEIHRILHLSPVNETRLHDMVLSQGRHFNAYLHVATGMTAALMLLMIAGVLHAYLKKGISENTPVPWLSFFGLALLLTVWESGGRLSMSYFPMLVIGGIVGLSVVEPLILRYLDKIVVCNTAPSSDTTEIPSPSINPLGTNEISTSCCPAGTSNTINISSNDE